MNAVEEKAETAEEEIEEKGGEKTDEELMTLLAQGNQRALDPIMHRYQNDIFRFCLHYLREVERAKELTQETFIRVYTACDRFDTARRFRPWVLCIARNLCLNELKRKKAIPMESIEEYASLTRDNSGAVLQYAADTPEGRVVESERMELSKRALDSLGDTAREIVILRFFERMSAREIAEIVGSTEGAIRTRLHRIMMSLREEFLEFRKDL